MRAAGWFDDGMLSDRVQFSPIVYPTIMIIQQQILITVYCELPGEDFDYELEVSVT